MYKSKLSSGLALCTALALPILSSAQATKHVDINFAAVVGDALFACGKTYADVGLQKTTITPQDFRFYVSSVELLKDDGSAVKVVLDQDGTWQYRDLALLDFEDGTGGCRNGNSGLRAKVSGTVPVGSYTGMRFVLGVPSDLDHLDASTAPAPLNTTAMFWSWRNGYKFMRLEVAPVSAPVASSIGTSQGDTVPKRARGFPMHLGSIGCVSTSPTSGPTTECTQSNRVAVTFDHFDVSKDVVTADVAALFAKTNLVPVANKPEMASTGATKPDTAATTGKPAAKPEMEGGGCMSSPGNASCNGVMEALGLPYGEIKSSVQSFFKLSAASTVAAATQPGTVVAKVE